VNYFSVGRSPLVESAEIEKSDTDEIRRSEDARWNRSQLIEVLRRKSSIFDADWLT